MWISTFSHVNRLEEYLACAGHSALAVLLLFSSCVTQLPPDLGSVQRIAFPAAAIRQVN